MTRRLVLFTLACLLTQAASTDVERAHAQGRSGGDVNLGRSHFEKGVEYFQDGDLRAALIEFKRAYIASPNYRVLYNLGQVCNELREYAEAQRYFQRYLADGAGEIDGARKRDVEATLVKLAGRIATLVLSCNVHGAEISIDDVVVGRSPISEPVRVSAGTRRISAVISGRPRVTRVVDAAGGDTLVVQLELTEPAPAEASAPDTAGAEPVGNSGGRGAALWVGMGAGALAIGTGVVAYLASVDAGHYRDAIRRKTTPAEVDFLHDRATTKALITDILLGATVVTGTVALVLAFTGGSGTPPNAADEDVAPKSNTQVSLGPGSLVLTRRFH